jgi:hypothetical protein
MTRAGFKVMTLRQSKSPSKGKVQTPRPRMARQVKRKAKCTLIIFFEIEGIDCKDVGFEVFTAVVVKNAVF